MFSYKSQNIQKTLAGKCFFNPNLTENSKFGDHDGQNKQLTEGKFATNALSKSTGSAVIRRGLHGIVQKIVLVTKEGLPFIQSRSFFVTKLNLLEEGGVVF